MNRGIITLAAIALFAPTSFAQDEKPKREELKVPTLLGDNPDKVPDDGDKGPKINGADLMRKADAAYSPLKTLSYKARCFGIGGMATRNPAVEATVRLSRSDSKKDAFEWRFAARGTARSADAASGTPFNTWFDGSAIHNIREKDKQVIEAGWAQNDEVMKDGAGLPLTWIVRWGQIVHNSFADPEGSAGWRYEGEALVNGELCDVVYVDYSESSDPSLFDAWWYLSKKDSLPRRVDMHFIDTGRGDGFIVTEITDLQTNTPVELASLASPVPEGFDVKKIKEPEKKAGGGGGGVVKLAGPQVGALAPDWTLKDPQGKEHKLSDYRGKVVVLDFWATWCAPCRAAMPGIQASHEKYGPKGTHVFGLNCWESGDAPGYMKEQKFTYGLLLQADEVASTYGVSGIPAIFVIGPDGKIIYRSVGFEGEEALEAAIEKGLGK